MEISWPTPLRVLLEAPVSCLEVKREFSTLLFSPPDLSLPLSLIAEYLHLLLISLGFRTRNCVWLFKDEKVPRVAAGNVGQDYAIFEQGASAGNVGSKKLVEEKKANPTALLLSAAMMLRHLQFPTFADRLETAVKSVVAGGECRTYDLGGAATTQQVVDAVVAAL